MVLNSYDDAWRAAWDALTPERNDDEDVSFGTFDPASNTLDLGDAVTFDQYRLPVLPHRRIVVARPTLRRWRRGTRRSDPADLNVRTPLVREPATAAGVRVDEYWYPNQYSYCIGLCTNV
ncbi:hypothetical protein GCM10008995_01920 [Halobellus salinus]|uniref:Uncharacterized protein n=1 Tax=Halobellus salinus TaxID=931585 RepID=A0A830EBH2_9EURY|nr:hypothetical protein GCM10008995_01920 [Halobellus salinus]